MSQKKLRWGILGVAKINDRLIPGFKKSKFSDLRAIASRDASRARAAADAADIDVAHAGYEAMLADPNIDAVYIPLPNHLHDEWTRKAADAGKHVLCEKPLTPDPKSAAALVAYCQAKGVKLMEGYMWPHHPRTAKLRDVLDRGDIGQVLRVSGAFTFPLTMNPANIRLKPEAAGGSLLDVGCYPAYGILWAFGGGTEIVAAKSMAKLQHGVDVELSGVVQTSDGRLGSLDCGFTAPLRQWLEITGSEGTIRVQKMWLPDAEASFVIELADRGPEIAKMAGYDQIVCMLDNFSRAVLENTPIRPDPADTVRTLRALELLAAR